MNDSLQNYIKKIFLDNGEKVKFKEGQTISSDQYVSGLVYFIESGTARIIIQDKNKLKTVKKIHSGDVVGAISIINTSACENVRAASNLFAISISDKIFKKLYFSDSKFKDYFDFLNYFAEIIEFSKFIRNQIPNLKYNLIEQLNLLEENILVINFSQKKIEILFKKKEIKIYSRSNNLKSPFVEINSYAEYLKFKLINIVQDF